MQLYFALAALALFAGQGKEVPLEKEPGADKFGQHLALVWTSAEVLGTLPLLRS